ncbi:sulfotransferase domain-containing protein [Thiohalobacter sp.]|uniref:sulfotransferase domain-containing protein n=1 Tax=Thiohalobacter sp. TaxID=2025948 RepID=UPI00260FB320|nr:sulfotransferase domain-containing protein [Thiohalobacter sp.]
MKSGMSSFTDRIPLRWRRRLRRMIKNARHGLSPTPRDQARTLIVAGVQRSGTNMVMDLLDRSMHTDVYHETDPRAYDRYEMRDLEVIQDLHDRSRAPAFVIKALCELQDLPNMLDRFAPARAVWVVRDYRDVVNSMLRSFPSQKREIELLVDDPNGNRWMGKGMSMETHQLLRRLWEQGLDDPSAAAFIWYFRNILFFEQALDRDPRVSVMFYEELVTAPDIQLHRLFDFFGLPYRPAIARDVFSSSIRKRQGPPINAEVAALCEEMLARFRKA